MGGVGALSLTWKRAELKKEGKMGISSALRVQGTA